MTNLARELRTLDRLNVPVLEDRIRERAAMPRRTVRTRPAPGPAALVAAFALALFAVAGAFAWRAFAPAESAEVGAPDPGEPWAGYEHGWTALAPPPEPRVGASVGWTGAEVVWWGGAAPEGGERAADGFAFDPSSGTWRRIATAPYAPGAGGSSGAVWTGSELLFYPAGLAYDPASDAWRALPPAPHDPGQRQAAVVWTGTEMVVFGGGDRGSVTARRGAAYDPEADRWRRIPDAPIGLNLLSGAWTGEEVLVFGSLLDGANRAETETSVGAAYDPTADRWRLLPPSDLSAQATSAVFVAGRLVAWDYEVRWQEYDPRTDSWSALEKMPMRFSECYPESAVADDVVFAWFCGQASILHPGRGWERLAGGVLEPRIVAGGQEHELFRFVSLAGAGQAFAMAAEGITVDEEGVPCYGCPGAPVGYWVYRSPGFAHP